MEPWQGGWAPWCVGSVFAAPQLLTAASSLPLGPLLFNAIGKPQRLLSAGFPRLFPDDSDVEISAQTQEVPSSSADAILPTALFRDHPKENNGSRLAMITHCPQFLGNRLQSLQCRDGEYVVFFPTGENADRIGSALCSKYEDKRWYVSNYPTDDSAELALRSGPTSDSLCSPILQLSAVRKSVWDTDCESLIAARSSHKVQFVVAHKEGVEFLFTTPIVASFEKLVSHVAWNQHLPSDAAVVLESGEVRLFDIQHAGFSQQLNPLQLNAKGLYKIPRQDPPISLSTNPIQPTKRKLRIAMKERKPPTQVKGLPFEWWRCEFAWHPKILLVAGSKEVSLMDFRVKFSGAYAQLGPLPKDSGDVGQDCHSSVVARLPGCANSAGYGNRSSVDDAFSSFARADHDGMYQFATTTRRHIMLFDTRRPHTPLLQWTHGMDSEPPNLLSMCSLSALRQQPSTSTSVTGKAILAATYQSGDIRAFCYGGHPTAILPSQTSLASTGKLSELDETLYAWRLPSKVSAPHAVPNYWSDVLSSEVNFFQQENARRYSRGKERRKENIMGLVVLSNDSNVTNLGALQKKEDDARGFSLMQLTGVGDILVQQSQAVEKLEHSQHFQHAQKFQAPNSLICEPTTSESKRGERKRKKHKKYIVKKLSHFSNYCKTGAALPGHADVSILSTSTPERPKSAPESQYDTSEGPKKDHAVHEADVLQRWIKHLDDHKLKVLIAETVKQSKVPLSVYEIAHKVLRRTLPRDFAILAAGMPADAFYLRYRNYLATLVADHLLQNSVKKDEGQKNVKVEGNSENHKGPSSQNLEASAIPLPFLLKRLFQNLEQTSTEHTDQGDDIGGKQHVENRDSELEGEAEVPRVGSASATNHEMLQSGYEQVGRLVDHLVEEGRSKGHLREVSLADSVESWQDTPAAVQLCLMQYCISQKELPVTSGQRQLFLGAHVLQSQPSHSGTIYETETTGSRSHTSVLERDAFCTFVGCVRIHEPSDTSPVGSQQVLYDRDLCPINLPFQTSSKVSQPEITTSLASLQTQLKHWQQKIVPYQTFCRDKLENFGS